MTCTVSSATLNPTQLGRWSEGWARDAGHHSLLTDDVTQPCRPAARRKVSTKQETPDRRRYAASYLQQESRCRPNKRFLSVLTGWGNPYNILPTVLTEQVNPVNSLHWARTPHHRPTLNWRLQLLVISLHNLQCKGRHRLRSEAGFTVRWPVVPGWPSRATHVKARASVSSVLPGKTYNQTWL